MKIKITILLITAIALFSFTAIQVEKSNKKASHSSSSKPSDGFALEDRDQWK